MKFLSEYGKWCVCVWGDESQSNTSCMVKPQTSDFENLLRNIIMHESHSETRGRGVRCWYWWDGSRERSFNDLEYMQIEQNSLLPQLQSYLKTTRRWSCPNCTDLYPKLKIWSQFSTGQPFENTEELKSL